MLENSNIRFEYLYRDAGNFKNWGEVVFTNTSYLSIEELSQQVIGALIDKTNFVAVKAGVPDLHFNNYDYDLDHGWHEYYNLTETNDDPNDSFGRTFETFICHLAQAKD